MVETIIEFSAKNRFIVLLPVFALAGGLWEAVAEGAMERIRPVSMTALANIIGLFPVMWSSGVGADVMKRLAAPWRAACFRRCG